MAIVSFFLFGGALAASIWTLWITIAPQADRIVDLLRNGPIVTPAIVAPVPARSSLRNVRVRSVAPSTRSPQRAAA